MKQQRMDIFGWILMGLFVAGVVVLVRSAIWTMAVVEQQALTDEETRKMNEQLEKNFRNMENPAVPMSRMIAY